MFDPANIEEGTEIQGYRIVGKLAETPLRVGYEAEHPMLGRRVAIKFAATEDWSEAFIVAARLMSKLEHPGISTLYDAGTYEGVPFIITEFIDGLNFGQRYLAERTPDLATTLRIFIDIADALVHAHQQGVVHRNVKTSDIIIANNGRAVLTDFELAVPVDFQLGEKTAGTPPFMAPEQWLKQKVSPATDVWGLGAVMYRALAGRYLGDTRPDDRSGSKDDPFEDFSHEDSKKFALSDDPIDYSFVGPDVPYYAISILKKCLQRDPEDRWPTAGHLRTALESAVSQMQIDSAAKTVAYSLPDVGDTIVVYAESHEDEISGDYRQFELTQFLGSGGFGMVFGARDTFADRDVALKFLKPEHLGDEDTVARFQRESRVLSKIHHPNIVQIFSQGRYGPTYFIALQVLEQASVASRLRENGPFAVSDARFAFEEILSGIVELHRHGIIHRDIKPANIGTLDGRYVISDLGFARSTDFTKVTMSGAIIGTLHYMAPEQAAGRGVTTASDMYSIGAVFYEMLTGQAPHRASSIGELVHAIQNDTIHPVASIRDDIPQNLGAMIDRLLSKDPDQRPPAAECLRIVRSADAE